MSIAKYLLCTALTLLLAINGNAQHYIQKNDIPVSANGSALHAAWAGGLNSPQLSSIDLNNDGILDLVAYDRSDAKLLCFINRGTANQIDYDFAPEYAKLFPSQLSDWVLLRDFDQDGYIDIFTAVPQVSNIRVFRNTSASNGNVLSFALYQDTIVSNYPPNLDMYSSKSDIPAIDDIDGDGDLDILTFHVGGTYVEWHKNTSIETTGGLLGMDYEIQSRCFGHFEEDPTTCSAFINLPPCGTGQREGIEYDFPRKAVVHSGSTLLSIDIDGNGLKDLLVGDVGCATLYALYNTGSTSIAHFSSVEDSFPKNSQRVNVVNFPAAYAIDVNNDGLKDLISAPNSTSQIEDHNGIQLHLNQGSSSVFDFQFSKFGFLQDEMIENGSGSMPCFWDYNGDGLKDLLIGGLGRFDSLSGFFPVLSLYKNVGSAQLPEFDLVDDNYLDLRNNQAFDGTNWIRPTSGDLDNDGDEDLILGNDGGTLFYFQNIATPGNPATFAAVISNYAGIDVGLNSSPQLVDLNSDNDLDLLIGNHRGLIHYYENQGNVNFPSFVHVTDTFGQIKINDFTGQNFSNGYAQPLAIDFDNDQDLDLLVGTVEGQVQVFVNISLAPNAPFFRSNDLFDTDFGKYSSPTATVLDSNKLSFVFGDIRGGLTLMRDGGPVSVVEANFTSQNIILYPNPASDFVNFELREIPTGSFSNYEIYNFQSKLVERHPISGNSGRIETSELTAGIYFVNFRGKNGFVSKKLILNK